MSARQQILLWNWRTGAEEPFFEGDGLPRSASRQQRRSHTALQCLADGEQRAVDHLQLLASEARFGLRL